MMLLISKWKWWRLARPTIKYRMEYCLARATGYRLAEEYGGEKAMLGDIDLVAREARWYSRLNRLYLGKNPWRGL